MHEPPATPPAEPVGVCAILAGGLGLRLGGAKPLTELCGSSLLDRTLATVREAGLEPLVVAKPDTDLGCDPGCEVLREPERPRHPLAGLAAALAQRLQPLVVTPCDLPLLPGALLRRLAETTPDRKPGGEEAIVVVSGPYGTEPLLGRYPPTVASALLEAAERGAPAHRTLAELGARTVSVGSLCDGDPRAFLHNVNTPADQLAAERLLSCR